MTADLEALGTLNIEIGHAESRGDKSFFETLLGSAFAFRSAIDPGIVDRRHFIDAVAESAPRATSIRSITFTGKARAIVSCVVTTEVDGTKKEFDNLRMFIRLDNGGWKLMAWANEGI